MFGVQLRVDPADVGPDEVLDDVQHIGMGESLRERLVIGVRALEAADQRRAIRQVRRVVEFDDVRVRLEV